MPKTYTVKQVADALGFSTNTVYKYLLEGKIKATRLGQEGRFKIPHSELSRLLGLLPVPTSLQSPASALPAPTIPMAAVIASPSNHLFDMVAFIFTALLSITSLVFLPGSQPLFNLSGLISAAGLLSVPFYDLRKHSANAVYLVSALCLSSIAFPNPTLIVAAFGLIVSKLAFKQPHQQILGLSLFLSIASLVGLTSLISTSIVILVGLGLALLSLLISQSFNRHRFGLVVGSLIFVIVCISILAAGALNQLWFAATAVALATALVTTLPFYREWDRGVNLKTQLHLLGLIALALLIGSGLTYFFKTYFDRQSSETITKETAIAAQVADTFFKDSLRTLQLVSQNPAFSVSLPSTVNLNQILQSVYTASPNLKFIQIFRPNSELLVTYPSAESASLLPAFSAPLFEQSLAIRKPTVLSQTGQVTIYAPLFNAANVSIGVVSGTLDLKVLADRLTDSKLNNLGYFEIGFANAVVLSTDNLPASPASYRSTSSQTVLTPGWTLTHIEPSSLANQYSQTISYMLLVATTLVSVSLLFTHKPQQT